MALIGRLTGELVTKVPLLFWTARLPYTACVPHLWSPSNRNNDLASDVPCWSRRLIDAPYAVGDATLVPSGALWLLLGPATAQDHRGPGGGEPADGLLLLAAGQEPIQEGDDDDPVYALARHEGGGLVDGLAADWRHLDERIDQLSGEIHAMARDDRNCERLMSVPGIGPIISSAMVAANDI